MNKVLLRAGAGFAMASMVYLIYMIIVKNIPLNLASFGLWLLIDIAIVVALLRARKAGDKSLPWLMIVFTVGTGVIVLLSTYNLSVGKNTSHWGTMETATVVAVVLAMVVWYKTSDKWGLIMSTNADAIASTIGSFAESQVVADSLTRLLNRDRFLAKSQSDARLSVNKAEATALLAQLTAHAQAATTAATSELAAASYRRALTALAQSLGYTGPEFDTLAKARDWFALDAARTGATP